MSVLELPPLEHIEWDRPPDLQGLIVPAEYVRPSVGDVQTFQAENKLIVPPYHEALGKIATRVTDEDISSGRLDEWIAVLQQARMLGQKKRLLTGLAAPQVGISKRLLLVNLNKNPDYSDTSTDDLAVLVNPSVELVDDQMYAHSEGCYSRINMGGMVLRYIRGFLHADNLDKPIFLEDDPTNLFDQRFRTVQHENDHLGNEESQTPPKLITDRIIEAMDRGQLPEGSLLWIHHEHLGRDKSNNPRPYSARMIRHRAGEKVGPWPVTVSREQCADINAGRIIMPQLIAA